MKNLSCNNRTISQVHVLTVGTCCIRRSTQGTTWRPNSMIYIVITKERHFGYKDNVKISVSY